MTLQQQGVGGAPPAAPLSPAGAQAVGVKAQPVATTRPSSVASRVVVFNGGRIAEYELRRALLDRLHRLGPSFYRRMSAGEIMSRATNDLLQVRLLLGFAVLNFINTGFGLASALSVMLTISPPLTLAALSTLPPLAIVTLWFGRQMFTRTRDNQESSLVSCSRTSPLIR